MKKLEVYFSKLPKSCLECPCFQYDEMCCGLDDETHCYFKDEIDGDKCPLKKIQSHDALCKRLDSLSKENSRLKKELDESFTEEDAKGLIEDRDKTIKFLQQQLAEKDKEIELLEHLGKHETVAEMFKDNAKLIIEKRQFAINELEKMKFKLKEKCGLINTAEQGYLQKFVRWHDICDLINKQIKELKGENL